MSDLIIPAPPVTPAEPEIESGPFWPIINPAKIREEHRIDGTATAPRLRAALYEAIAETNHALRAWRIAHQELGTNALASVAADKIAGESILIQKYRRAVGCYAKAILLERHRDYDATAEGEKTGEPREDQIGDNKRDWHHAIADITGRTRSTVELI